jgi:hypothetical protein
MSIATLSKFTVPLASDVSAPNQALLMPKLQYRFRVTFANFGITTPTTELTKQVIDVTRPNLTFDDITLDVYNSRIYLAGKHTWDPITLTLREDVGGFVQQLVGEQLQKQFDFYEQVSAASGIDYKFSLRIEILDGGNGVNIPGVLETTEMYGCYVQNANYNQLSYATSDAVTLTLSIKFDNCIQTPFDRAGIGIPITPRTTGTLATGGGI